MSRIGNKLITVPAGVEVTVAAGNEVTVKGPKGTLTQTFNSALTIEVEGNVVTVKRPNDEKHVKQLHGTTRALLNNMVVGVSQGYQKNLKVVGIGYRCAVKGSKLTLNVGYSNPVEIEIPKTLEVTCLDAAGKVSPTDIQVKGISKQEVGQFAAEVRAVRKPEPYKGKGIKYVDEFIRRKEGKTAGKK
ncbi:MAG: 50S ribosomal protein L6 [Firmicutes bacterium]|nr:50S ribosomal protein L6 [Bacillota bacterium]